MCVNIYKHKYTYVCNGMHMCTYKHKYAHNKCRKNHYITKWEWRDWSGGSANKSTCYYIDLGDRSEFKVTLPYPLSSSPVRVYTVRPGLQLKKKKKLPLSNRSQFLSCPMKSSIWQRTSTANDQQRTKFLSSVAYGNEFLLLLSDCTLKLILKPYLPQ